MTILTEKDTKMEDLKTHNEMERLDYERAVALYKQALENIEEAMVLFENSPLGMPEELDMLFGESEGNESLWNLQKEVTHLEEDMDDCD